MAKILVADDNSNIQKMVGLALKDQGIDVVAVGNGEAAVRKISDVRPDLVLADVFMPVRNGYEVCKYVKDDTALSHIPVILLVGAFDPLDEQEAQRVGADGVLKKPFVPPDPLISMVKSALSRAGVLPSEKPAEPPPMAAVDLIAPRVPAADAPTFPDFAQHGTTDHDQAAPEPVRMDAGAPLAFGSLLETPVAKEEEEDTSYVTGATTQAAPERSWGVSHEAEEVEEEEESHSSWRRDGEELPDDGTSGGGAGDWRDTAMAEAPTRRSARESWEPVRGSKEEPVTVAATETLPARPVIAAQEQTVPASSGNAWPNTISPQAKDAPVVSQSAPVVDAAPAVEAAPTASAVVEEKKAEPVAGFDKQSLAESWFSPAPSPWDAELKKASELAAGWDSPKSDARPSAYAAETTVKNETAEQPTAETVAEEAGLSSSAVEAIREEAAQVAEAAPVSGVTGVAAEPKMDELVAKVLAKMSPEVLQAVTREILKPVVEAMVRDELNSKKS